MRVGIIASERSCLGRWALTAQLSPAPTTPPPPPPWSFRLPHGSRPGSQFLTFVSSFSLYFVCVCETADRRFTTHDSLLHTAIERRKTKQQNNKNRVVVLISLSFFFKSFSRRLLLLLDFDFSGSLSVNGRLSHTYTHTHSHTRKTKLA